MLRDSSIIWRDFPILRGFTLGMGTVHSCQEQSLRWGEWVTEEGNGVVIPFQLLSWGPHRALQPLQGAGRVFCGCSLQFTSASGQKQDTCSHLHSPFPLFGPHFRVISTGVFVTLVFRPIDRGMYMPTISSTLLVVSILIGLLPT